MNNRLKQFLAAENISQAQFAETINVVRASVSHVLAGRNNPGYDFIKSIMDNYPTLNIEWLMLGKGKMYKDKVIQESTLFALEEEIIPEAIPKPVVKIESSPEIETIDNQQQPIAKQRNISKIIVFFDDGTYQEIKKKVLDGHFFYFQPATFIIFV